MAIARLPAGAAWHSSMDFSRVTKRDTGWGSGPVSQFVKKMAIFGALSCPMQIVITSRALKVTAVTIHTRHTSASLLSFFCPLQDSSGSNVIMYPECQTP